MHVSHRKSERHAVAKFRRILHDQKLAKSTSTCSGREPRAAGYLPVQVGQSAELLLVAAAETACEASMERSREVVHADELH